MMSFDYHGSSGDSSFRPRPLPGVGIYPALPVGRATILGVGYMEMSGGRPRITQLFSLYTENGVVYAPVAEVGRQFGIIVRNEGTSARAYPMRVAGIPLFTGQPDDPNDVISQMWAVQPRSELVIAHMMGERGRQQGRAFETSFNDEYGAAGATYGVGTAEAEHQQGLLEIWERTQQQVMRHPHGNNGLLCATPKSMSGLEAYAPVHQGEDQTGRNPRGGKLSAPLHESASNRLKRGQISAVVSTADVGFGEVETVVSSDLHATFNRDALKLPDIRIVAQTNIVARVAERLRCEVEDIPWMTSYALDWYRHQGYLPPERIASHVPRRPPRTNY